MSLLDSYTNLYIKKAIHHRIKTASWWRDRYNSPEGDVVYARGIQELQQNLEKAKAWINDPGKKAELNKIYNDAERSYELFDMGSGRDAPREVVNLTNSIRLTLQPLFAKDENFIKEFAQQSKQLEQMVLDLEDAIDVFWNSPYQSKVDEAKAYITQNRESFENLSNEFLDNVYKQVSSGDRNEAVFGIHEYGVYPEVIEDMQPRIKKVQDFINAEIANTERQSLDTQDVDISRDFYDREIQNREKTERIQQPQQTQDFNYADVGIRPDNRLQVQRDQAQTIFPTEDDEYRVAQLRFQ